MSSGFHNFFNTRSDGNKYGMCCCNVAQNEAFIVMGVTAILTGILWRSVVAAPLKLVAVFLHEFSHATACWLTCGKVKGIEVNERFGGLTRTAGGSRWVTLSAGYTGSVVWGAFFILMTWDKLPTRIAAGFFMVSCIATILVLKIQQKQLCGMKCCFGMSLRMFILLLGAIPAAMWILEEKVDTKGYHPLRYCMLMVGTVCTLHALYDCVHDVFLSKINNADQGKSDAVMFAEEICGTARCWGLLWSMIALLVTGLALYGVVALTGDCL